MGTKQVIVMRRDLNMRTGKMIAQGAHAAMSFLTKGVEIEHNFLRAGVTTEGVEWLMSSFKKIVVYVNSEGELIDLYKQAKGAGLTVHLVTDSGLTEFKGVPTNTCIAIGPNEEGAVDKITGGLKLL